MWDDRVEDQQSAGGGHQNRQAGAGLASERLFERRVKTPRAEQARDHQSHTESIDDRRAVAECLHKTDEQKSEWPMFGQISVGADRLRERVDTAVGDIDFARTRLTITLTVSKAARSPRIAV